MDEDKKKYLMIGIIVACLVLAGGITFMNMGGGGGSGGNRPIVMLCDSCGVDYEITSDEFREQMRQSSVGGDMMMMRGPMILPCRDCGETAAYRATRCPECQEAFVSGDAGDEKYLDKCPACGHSPTEQRMLNR
jgi:hypothetical protein